MKTEEEQSKTSLRKAAEELPESENIFRTIFETSIDAIYLHERAPDALGHILLANAAASEMLGYTNEEFLELTVTELNDPTYEKPLSSILNELKTERRKTFEWAHLTKDGRSLPVEISVTLFESGGRTLAVSSVRDISGWKKEGEALHASEIRYRGLFEAAQDGILILDAGTGEIVEVNPSLIDLLGFSREQLLGKKLWELGIFSDIVANKDNFDELQRKGFIRYEDLPLKTADGKGKAVEFVSNVYMVENKKVVQCNIRDVTDRKQVEEALHASEIRYRGLFEAAQGGILILDAGTGKIVEVNPYLIDLLGFSRDQFLGKNIWDLGVFRDLVANKDNFEELQRKEYIRYEDLPLETADGRQIAVEFVSNVYTVENKKVVQCNIRDVTDRKQVEEALHASEIRYRGLFEAAQDGILILDAETGEIVEVNPSLIDLLGFSREQLLGKKLWELGIFSDIVANKDNFDELQRKGFIRYEDLPLKTADGKGKAVEFVSNVYTVENKKVVQCNIRDITKRKKAEDALRTINKKLNLLSSITRHDIINQISAAEMFVELMEMEGEIPQDSKGAEDLKKVADALNTIERQIVFTRDYQDLGVLSPGWQKVGLIIDETTGTVTKELTVKNEVRILEIFADPLFEKVIFNLFDNAVRHGEKITTIRFYSEETPEGFKVVCEDDGIGILADFKEKIFNRQYFKHTGLGLFLSREILSITGMTIAETGVPGEGARFEILVPEGMWRSG